MKRIPEDSTIEIYFNTVDSDGAPVAPSSAFASSDFHIYKNGDANQKTTNNGITVTSPFDSEVGLHLISIDTSNDTVDIGFWVDGGRYMVVFDTSKTVDSVSIDGRIVPNGEFYIENAASASAVADAVWDEATSGHTTAGTFGAQVKTVLDDVPNTSEFEARTLAAASYFDASSDSVNVGSVLGTSLTESSSGNLADNLSQFYDLDTTTTNTVDDVGGGSLTAAGIADAVWDEVISTSSHNTDSTAGKMLRLSNTVVAEGTVGGFYAATGISSDVTGINSQFNDQLLIFTSGTLINQARPISSFLASGGSFSFDESFSAAPSPGDTFIVRSTHIHPATQIAQEVWGLDITASHNVGTFGYQLNDVVTDIFDDTGTNIPAQITALNDFDPENDVVANVTLVDTTTTNTDMRGTDSAALATSLPTNFSDLAITASTGRVTVGTNNDKTGYSISGTLNTLDEINSSLQSYGDSNWTTGSGGDATEDKQDTIISALAVIDNIVDNIILDTDELQSNQGNWLTATGFSTFDPDNDTVAHVTLVDTTTTNTDMRGTNNAALASSLPTNFSDLAITATNGYITVGTNNDKTGYTISGTLTTLDDINSSLETYGDARWATATGFSTFDASSDSVNIGSILGTDLVETTSGNIADNMSQFYDLDTTTTNTVDDVGSGIGSGLTAGEIADAVWDETTSGHTTSGTFGAQVKTVLDDVPTTAEFQARTLVAADYFDPDNDEVASVTVVGTCNVNSDMRGTDNAALATSLSTVAGNVVSILDDTDTTIPGLINDLQDLSSDDIKAAVKAIVVESEGTITLQQAMSLMLSVLAGKSSGNGLTFMTPNGNATRVIAVCDEDSNRTSITLTPSS